MLPSACVSAGSSSYVGFASFAIIVLLFSSCHSGDSTSPNSPTSPSNVPPSGSFTNGVLQAYVKASNPGGRFVPLNGVPVPFGDQFGKSIGLSDDTLVVGAPNEESCATGINGDQANNGCSGAGAVYVFTRTNGTWSQQAYLKASDAHASGGLGNLVALSGDTIAATGSSQTGAGVVYVFTRTNGTWSQQAIVTPSNAKITDLFGFSLALDGETLAVGALGDSTCASGINGDPSVISSGCFSGAAYVFRRTNGVWAQEAYIKPPNRRDNVGYGFGYSVAVSGNTVAVGAQSESGCATGVNGDETLLGCIVSGAVYVYTRSDGGWMKEAYIKASTSASNLGFGFNMALSDNTLAVDAGNESTCATGVNGNQNQNFCNAAGAVYVFTRSNGIWSQQAYIKASNTDQNDAFGQKGLALLGDTLAVGAQFEASCATGLNGNQADNNCIDAGAVYVFTRSAGIWSQAAYVKATNTDARDEFGSSVALSKNTLAVGALGESSCASGINGNQMDNSCPLAGAVYVYVGQ